MLDWLIDALAWIARILVHHVLARFIKALFYWPGWAMLRLLTLGHYPPGRGVKHKPFAVALFAAATIMSALLMLATSSRPARREEPVAARSGSENHDLTHQLAQPRVQAVQPAATLPAQQ